MLIFLEAEFSITSFLHDAHTWISMMIAVRGAVRVSYTATIYISIVYRSFYVIKPILGHEWISPLIKKKRKRIRLTVYSLDHLECTTFFRHWPNVRRHHFRKAFIWSAFDYRELRARAHLFGTAMCCIYATYYIMNGERAKHSNDQVRWSWFATA